MMVRRFLAGLILVAALVHPAGAQLFNPGGSGASGRGVSSVAINGAGHLIVTYSDATTTDAGLVLGTAGATGATGPAGPAGSAGSNATIACGTGTSCTTAGSVTTITATGTAGVASFNTRSGTITLTSGDVTGALGFTPYSAANPSGYIAAAGAPVQSVAGRNGAVVLGVADVSGALSAATATSTYQPLLGFTPYNSTNPAGYQTAAQVAAAVAAGGGSTAFVRTAYTASGAIAITDTLSVLNGSSGTLAMTLANGTTDGQGILIKLLGAANATVTANIDGSSGNVVAMTASGTGTLKDSLKMRWSVADATWIAE